MIWVSSADQLEDLGANDEEGICRVLKKAFVGVAEFGVGAAFQGIRRRSGYRLALNRHFGILLAVNYSESNLHERGRIPSRKLARTIIYHMLIHVEEIN